MASKQNQPPSERSRVRFILVDFDGTSSDMHQLAQTFAAAVKAPPQNVLVMNPPAHQNGAPPAIEVAPAPLNGANGVHADSHEDVNDIVFTAPAPNKPQNGSTKKKLKTPSVISSLEFTTGPKPFKEYFQEQAPDEHSKRYLVCVQWLKEFRGIAEVGADHIYSCYRAVGLTVPDDVLSVFRGLKKQAWVENGEKRGLFKITHIGEGQLKCSPA
jgi:hypothetical protein